MSEVLIYDEGFLVNELFMTNSVGIVTARDAFTIHESKEKLQETITMFLSLEDEAARNRFNLGKDVRDWSIVFAKKDLINSGPDFNKIVKISYRPFDGRFTYYTGKSKGFHCMPRGEVMQHFLKGENVGLVFSRQATNDYWSNIQITNAMIDNRYHFSYKGIPQQAPLYLYPEITGLTSKDENINRKPNLNKEIVKEFANKIDSEFTDEKEDRAETFAPIDILDYIYAVLHCPSYREKYKEFLKIDFPRVPYPENAETFWRLVKFGSELRLFHLLEHPKTSQFITTYPKNGSNDVVKIRYESDKVWINKDQYFDNVPETAWNFYIGGYQPAQKWLKDRKGRTLARISHQII